METYVYFTIILFSIIILALYIYIIFEKIIEKRKKKRKNIYLDDTAAFIDSLIQGIGEGYKRSELTALRNMVSNNIKREIIEEKIKNSMESSAGLTRENLIMLGEEIRIVDYEIANLKSKNNFKAALACKILGELRSRKSLSEIDKLVDSDNTDIKYNALMALAKIGDINAFIKAFERISSGSALSERSLTEIVDTFEGDKLLIYKAMINSTDPYISSIFIKSAGNYMDKTLIEEIASFLKDDDKNRRIAAIKAIGQAGDKKYMDEIAKALEDSDWEIRAVAARSLGSLSDKRALGHLVKSLCDREWWVRYNSAYSIVELPGGFEVVKTVLNGSDKFAKEILISAIENSGILKNLSKEKSILNLEEKYILDMINEFEMSKRG